MKTVNLRKYGNRKLYNEDVAAYVSMVGLSDIIARGDRVQVTCDLTQDDITVETIARAYCERLKAGVLKDRTKAQESLEILIRGVTVKPEGK